MHCEKYADARKHVAGENHADWTLHKSHTGVVRTFMVQHQRLVPDPRASGVSATVIDNRNAGVARRQTSQANGGSLKRFPIYLCHGA
jgi:hypothetical protein